MAGGNSWLALASMQGSYRTFPGTVSLVLHYLELTRKRLFSLSLLASAGIRESSRGGFVSFFFPHPSHTEGLILRPLLWLNLSSHTLTWFHTYMLYRLQSSGQDCMPPEMLCTSAATLDRLPRFFLKLAERPLRLACLLALVLIQMAVIYAPRVPIYRSLAPPPESMP
ncbi:hypothetical protein KCU71_g56, partial [Aureobasidium melanogenum]